MCRSQNVGSYEEAGEVPVSYTELQKGHEDLCRKDASGITPAWTTETTERLQLKPVTDTHVFGPWTVRRRKLLLWPGRRPAFQRER